MSDEINTDLELFSADFKWLIGALYLIAVFVLLLNLFV